MCLRGVDGKQWVALGAIYEVMIFAGQILFKIQISGEPLSSLAKMVSSFNQSKCAL